MRLPHRQARETIPLVLKAIQKKFRLQYTELKVIRLNLKKHLLRIICFNWNF